MPQNKYFPLLISIILLIAVFFSFGCAPIKTSGIQRIAVLPFEDLSGEYSSVDNADFVRRTLAYPFNSAKSSWQWPFEDVFAPLLAVTGIQIDFNPASGLIALQPIEETDALLKQNKINTPAKLSAVTPERLGKMLGVDGIVYGQLQTFKNSVVSDYFSGYDFRVGQEWTDISREGTTLNLVYTFPLLDSSATPEGIAARRNFSIAQKIEQKINLRVYKCVSGQLVLSGTLNLSAIRPYAAVIPEWNYQELDFTEKSVYGDKVYPSIYFYHYVLLAKALGELNGF